MRSDLGELSPEFLQRRWRVARLDDADPRVALWDAEQEWLAFANGEIVDAVDHAARRGADAAALDRAAIGEHPTLREVVTNARR